MYISSYLMERFFIRAVLYTNILEIFFLDSSIYNSFPKSTLKFNKFFFFANDKQTLTYMRKN